MANVGPKSWLYNTLNCDAPEEEVHAIEDVIVEAVFGWKDEGFWIDTDIKQKRRKARTN